MTTTPQTTEATVRAACIAIALGLVLILIGLDDFDRLDLFGQISAIAAAFGSTFRETWHG